MAYSTGQPALTITGDSGTVYAIEYATDLSPTNHWTEGTLLQVRAGSYVWVDPSTPGPAQRFYRAVSVPAPANTNLVFIQPGTFTMGSPTNEALRSSDETLHSVTISRGFWMGKYLVTQGAYLAVVGNNPSYFTPTNGYALDLTRPVEQVSWNDATNYCAMLTAQELGAGQIPANYVYRLPTESEWELACRAGTTTALYLGSALRSGQANFDGQFEYDAAIGEIANTNGIFLGTTTPVGNYAANAWGLYDMIGNVLQWCQDVYGVYPIGPVTDPQGLDSGAYQVERGGSWLRHGKLCRSAQRDGDVPNLGDYDVGFRVVLAPGQP